MLRSRRVVSLAVLWTSTLALLCAIPAIPGRAQVAAKSKGSAKAPAKADLSKLDPAQATTFRGHKKDVWQVAFHPNGRHLVSCGDDAQVVTWNLATGREASRNGIHDHPLHGLDFDRRGTVFCVVSMTPWAIGFSGALKIQDVVTGHVEDIPSNHQWTFQCVDVHPEGRLVAAGGEDRALRVWNLAAPRVERKKKGVKLHFPEYGTVALPDTIVSVAFHPSPRKGVVAAGCRQGFVRVYEIRQGRLVPFGVELAGHNGDARCVQFRPGTDTLVSGGLDGLIKFWDPAKGELVRSIEAGAGAVNALAFSPDGTLLASAHDGRVIKLWDAATGKELHTLKGHEGVVLDVAFSADGRKLASCGRDFAVVLWRLYPE